MLLERDSLVLLCNHSLSISFSCSLCLDCNISRRNVVIHTLKWLSVHRLKCFLRLFHHWILIRRKRCQCILVRSFEGNVAWLEHRCSLDIGGRGAALLHETVVHVLYRIRVGRLFLSFEYTPSSCVRWNVWLFRKLSCLWLLRLQGRFRQQRVREHVVRSLRYFRDLKRFHRLNLIAGFFGVNALRMVLISQINHWFPFKLDSLVH